MEFGQCEFNNKIGDACKKIKEYFVCNFLYKFLSNRPLKCKNKKCLFKFKLLSIQNVHYSVTKIRMKTFVYFYISKMQ